MLLEGFTFKNEEDRDIGKEDSQGEVVNPPVSKGFNIIATSLLIRAAASRWKDW